MNKVRTCPKCKSNDLDSDYYADIDNDTKIATIEFSCWNCGTQFTQEFKYLQTVITKEGEY